MISFDLLQIVIQQSWQVALLASLVWLVTRYVGRERAHLSHMLWVLVLIKCVTPPIWSSPIGLFSRISNQLEIAVGYEPNTKALPKPKAVWQSKSQEGAIRIGEDLLDFVSSNQAKINAARHTSQWNGSFFAITVVWIAGTLLFALFSILRFIAFLRLIYRTTCETSPEVARCVKRLNVRLELRRNVGVRVVNSLLGPAVYGLWKPVIILPEAIIAGRSELELEPLIAHEMVHVRRGDLWLAWVQSLACCLGWFHPMVWLASRRVTIESERCCDEETIASLRCKPSTYARSLLDVLELKHLLRVAPALPGVRPVDVTLSRLERIMRLGHGSRSRSPWWVWCIAFVSAIAVLPGADYVTAQSPELKQPKEITYAPEYKPNPAPVAPSSDESLANQADFIRMDVRIVKVASGTEESKKMFAWIEEQSIHQQEQSVPIMLKIPYIGRLYNHLNSRKGIQLASAASGVEKRHVSLVALLSEEKNSHFVEKILDPANPLCISRPCLSAVSGRPTSIEIGQFDPQSRELLLNGLSLSMKSTIIEKDKIQFDYEMTRVKSLSAKDGDEQLSKDQSTKDLSTSIRKSTVQTSVEIRLDQTFVVASQQSYDDAPYEIVVVKCSMPFANQKPTESRK